MAGLYHHDFSHRVFDRPKERGPKWYEDGPNWLESEDTHMVTWPKEHHLEKSHG